MRKFVKHVFASGLSFIWIAGLVIFIDRMSKLWVVKHLELYQPMAILPVFNLTLAYNRGAAFSFLHSANGWQNILLGSFAILVSGIVLVWLYQLPRRSYWMNTALCLILGGALGNAVDRALKGYVTDFLDFHWGNMHFAIFNLADSAICIGAIMISLHWLFVKK